MLVKCTFIEAHSDSCLWEGKKEGKSVLLDVTRMDMIKAVGQPHRAL